MDEKARRPTRQLVVSVAHGLLMCTIVGNSVVPFADWTTMPVAVICCFTPWRAARLSVLVCRCKAFCARLSLLNGIDAIHRYRRGDLRHAAELASSLASAVRLKVQPFGLFVFLHVVGSPGFSHFRAHQVLR